MDKGNQVETASAKAITNINDLIDRMSRVETRLYTIVVRLTGNTPPATEQVRGSVEVSDGFIPQLADRLTQMSALIASVEESTGRLEIVV